MSKLSHKKKIESITTSIQAYLNIGHDPLMNDVFNWMFLKVSDMSYFTNVILKWDLDKSKLSEQDESTIDYLETFLKP